MSKSNGNDEHPKSAIELMENTAEAIYAYAAVKKISPQEAAQILILNELRCIHWHFDAMMPKKEDKNAN
jgi:hypothetical protein